MPFLKKEREADVPQPQPDALLEQQQQKFSVIQDRELQKAGFEEALRQGQEHLASTFTKGKRTYEDSLEMSKVKSSEQTLLRFFSEQKLAAEPDVFEAQLATANFLYEQLIQNCQTYETSHKRPWTASGKARKQMVQQIRKIAEHEIGKLKATAEVLQKRNVEDAGWADVLGSMRVANIDLATHEIEKTGGGTSDVTVINYPNTKLFYKKEEKLLPLQEDMRALIDQKPEWKPHKKLMTKLLGLIDNENPVNLGNIAIGSYVELQAFLGMVSAEMTFSAKEQEELATFMPAFAAAFKKLNTRYGVAKDVGIELGQDLSKRNVATSRIASLLGVPGLVTDSASVTLKTGPDSSEKGVVTVMAKGKPFREIKAEGLPVVTSPKMMKELMNLQILDTICGQLDRNSSNLFFTYEKKNGKLILTGVTGIDSDMAFGLTDYHALEKSQDGFLQLKPIEQNGVCTLPYLDQTFCEQILALDKNTVFFVLSDLLKRSELDALWKRIEGVQNLLRNSMDRMTDEPWPDADLQTLRAQYNGSYFSKISDVLK